MSSADSDEFSQKLAQYAWVWLNLDEVEADFLRFYGIDEPVDSLPGSKFFKLAKALPSYGGAVTTAARLQQEEATAPQTPSFTPSRRKKSNSSEPVYNFERLKALKQGGKNIQNVDATKSNVDADTKEAFRERMRKAETE